MCAFYFAFAETEIRNEKISMWEIVLGSQESKSKGNVQTKANVLGNQGNMAKTNDKPTANVLNCGVKNQENAELDASVWNTQI